MSRAHANKKLYHLLRDLGYVEIRRHCSSFLHKHQVLHSTTKGKLRITNAETPLSTIDPTTITIDGKAIDYPFDDFTIALHKPMDYVCSTARETEQQINDETQDVQLSKIIYDLLPPRFSKRDPVLSCIGRLDKDAHGLVLLSQDGKLVNHILSPQNNIPRTYVATVKGIRAVSKEDTAIFCNGKIHLHQEKEPCLPCHMEVLSYDKVENVSECQVKIHEGKYHQVKRMFAAIGFRVVGLKRTAIGHITLDEVQQEGSWKQLTKNQVDQFWSKQ